MDGHVQHLNTVFNAMIEANRSRNCPTARSTWNRQAGSTWYFDVFFYFQNQTAGTEVNI